MTENLPTERAPGLTEEGRRKHVRVYQDVLDSFGSSSKEAQSYKDSVNDEVFTRRALILERLYNPENTSSVD